MINLFNGILKKFQYFASFSSVSWTLTIVSIIGGFQTGYSQTIWSEDFNNFSDGTTDPGNGKFIMDHSRAIPCGIFEIRNHQVFAEWSADTISHLGMNVWVSDTIDISSYPYVQVSFDAASGGSLDPYDTIRATYQVDAEPEALFYNHADDLPLTTINYKGISGNSLIVKIYFRSSNAAPPNPPEENHIMDNVIVAVDTTTYRNLYSRGGTLDWANDTSWSLTSGGISCGCIPDTNTIVTIENSSSVTVSSAAVAKQINVNSGSILFLNSTLDIYGNGGLTNNASADISGTGELRFHGPGYFPLNNSGTISVNNITTYGPGFLNISNSGSVILNGNSTINGPVQVDINNQGTFTYYQLTFNLNCCWLNIYGPNSVTVQSTFSNTSDYNTVAVMSGARIRFEGAFNCGNQNLMLRNYGTVEQLGVIQNIRDSTGINPAEDTLNRVRFFNFENAIYDFRGTNIDSDLKLYAQSNNNTFIYSRAGNQPVVSARDAYFNLIIRGTSGTKTLIGNVIVNNDFSIENGRTLDVGTNNYSITLKGDWSNAGTFNARSGQVTLIGSSLQTISNSANEDFYNLTINNTGDGVQLNNGNITVSNNLVMTSGNVNTGAYRLTLGSGTSSIGALTHTSGSIIGAFQRWVNATSINYQFPVGTSTNDNTLTLNFFQLNSGTVTARFHAADPGFAGLPILTTTDTVDVQFTNGYWSLLPGDGLATSDYNLNLSANGFSSYSVMPSTRIITRINGNNWETPISGVHQSASGFTAVRNSLTNGISASRSEFGLANNSNRPTAHFVETDIQGCVDNPVTTLSVALSGIQPWELVVSHNGAPGVVHSGTSSPYDFDVTQNGTYTITRVTTLAGDGAILGSPAIVTFNNLPNPGIIGNSNLCPNASGQTYSTSNSVLNSYYWDIVGGTIYSGQGTNEVVVNWGDGSVSSWISVTETITSPGCTGQDTLFIDFGSDTIDPTISCSIVPDTISAGVSCSAILADLRGSVVISDNCTPTANLNLVQSPASGNTLILGNHTLTFTVTDGSGNTNSCSINLTVEDNTNPTIVCPSDITQSSDSGSCGASGIALGTPLTSDNCTEANVTNNAPADYSGGVHTIIWTVTDNSGNMAACSQSVSIIDNQAPEISCPDPIFLQPNMDSCIVEIPVLNSVIQVIDNCSSEASIIIVQDPVAGTLTSTGIKHILVTATDEAGNQSSCEALILVMPVESEGITASLMK